MISNAPCQREMTPSDLRLRVMSLEPSAIATINTQVVRTVTLSSAKPWCHKTCWSELKFTATAYIMGIRAHGELSAHMRDNDTRQEKAKQARQ